MTLNYLLVCTLKKTHQRSIYSLRVRRADLPEETVTYSTGRLHSRQTVPFISHGLVTSLMIDPSAIRGCRFHSLKMFQQIRVSFERKADALKPHHYRPRLRGRLCQREPDSGATCTSRIIWTNGIRDRRHTAAFG